LTEIDSGTAHPIKSAVYQFLTEVKMNYRIHITPPLGINRAAFSVRHLAASASFVSTDVADISLDSGK
jgi:hypothetical protein